MSAKNLLSIIALFAMALVFSTQSAAAQGEAKPELRIPIPDVFELPTVKDDEGLLQWDRYVVNCPNCKGAKKTVCFHCLGLLRITDCIECKQTKETPCRVCAGEGMMPSPLEKAPCPGCIGAGMFPCHVCAGEGNYRIVGGSDKPTDCAGCKGAGGYACSICRGARVVDPPKLKPSVGEAELKDLEKARDAVAELITALDAWEATGDDTRKEIKHFQKLLVPVTRYLPALKSAQKDFDGMMKRVMKGAGFESHEQNEARAINHYRRNNLYYLRHQKRLLDLCILRQEANLKVLEGKDK